MRNLELSKVLLESEYDIIYSLLWAMNPSLMCEGIMCHEADSPNKFNFYDKLSPDKKMVVDRYFPDAKDDLINQYFYVNDCETLVLKYGFLSKTILFLRLNDVVTIEVELINNQYWPLLKVPVVFRAGLDDESEEKPEVTSRILLNAFVLKAIHVKVDDLNYIIEWDDSFYGVFPLMVQKWPIDISKDKLSDLLVKVRDMLIDYDFREYIGDNNVIDVFFDWLYDYTDLEDWNEYHIIGN